MLQRLARWSSRARVVRRLRESAEPDSAVRGRIAERLAGAMLVASAVACSGPNVELLAPGAGEQDGGGGPNQGEPGATTTDRGGGNVVDPSRIDSDGDGLTDAEEIFLGTNPDGEGGSCAYAAFATEQRKRAVDILLVVDNSSSMDAYITAIVERINEDFAAILMGAEVDYRLILISRHGAIDHTTLSDCDDHGVCIQPPLAAGECDPNAPPKQTERFKHYSVCIDSNDALRKIKRAFDGTEVSGYFTKLSRFIPLTDATEGFKQWLRIGAFRTFVLVSDDDSASPDSEFVTWLYSLDPGYFGTRDEPNWRFHSIVNVAEHPIDPLVPWSAAEPLVETGCWDGTSRWTGVDYQRLSIQSGGLRFPYCRSDNYDAVFRAVAQSVTESATLPCSFTPAASEMDGAADFSRVLIRYESGSFKRTLKQVGSAASCVDDGFYVVGTEIRLCPSVCAEVGSDTKATIQALVACFDESTCGDGKLDAGESCDDGNRIDGDGCDFACLVELQ